MSVVKGLPSELKMDMVSLPDSVSSYAVKVVPQNLTSIASSSLAISSTNFTASGVVTQISMPSQQINFDIPAGQNKNTWIDTAKSTISFRVAYNRVENSTTALSDTMKANLIHNAFNYFNRIFAVSATGNIIDDVPLINLAHTNYLQNNYNAADVDSLALAYGFNADSGTSTSANAINANTGHSIAGWSTTASTSSNVDFYYSYELPLPSSVIGAFAKQMFPIGQVSKLTLSLVTDAIAPVCIQCTGSTTGSTTLKITLTDIALNLSYVDLGEAGSALVGGMGAPRICAGITHRVSSTTLASGTSGQVSSLMGLRGSSVRSVTTRVVENVVSSSGNANDKFDSKLPLAYGINYFLQGNQRVPPFPLDCVRTPASVFMRALHASNAFNERQYKNAGTPQTFCVYTATSGSFPSDRDRYLSSSTTGYNFLANFEFAMNLQKVSKSKILDGMNFNTSNQYLEMNLGLSSTNSLTLYHIAELDVIYVITPDGDIQTRI